ncbi:YSC84-related protein [Bradyrhizobium sp.]|uniref:YSC84-related protein n=1 Tax=Bradyrhizobium sp. TaxID=376 RepID=UPI003C35B306
MASMPNVTIPSGLDSEHRQKLQELKSLSGAAFERQYRESQIKGHEAAIKIFTDYAGTGSDDKEAGLKSWAKASVPILEKHLQRAENLPQPKGPSVAAAPGNSSDLAATGSRSMTTGAAPTRNSNGGAGQALVNDSVGVIKKMEADNKLAQLVKTAKGLYIVPEFGRGALVVGARGGAGLLTVHENGKWSDPAFYDLGGISVGPQVGGSGGAVVFVLMNQKAVDAFRRSDSFSLNAGAGISIANYSDNSQESWGKSDIVLWSDTAGAYIGATISVTDITSNREDDRNYYGKNVDLTNILNGSVTNANAAELTTVLPE